MRALRIALVALAISLPWTPERPLADDAAAALPQSAGLSAPDRDLVARVEDYLTGIDTLHARFRQISSNGAAAGGEVWIDRPGKLRFEYDPPHPVLIVSNGFMLVYIDRDLEQTSYVPIAETPLWFLVRERVDLSDISGYGVAGVDRAGDTLRLAVVQDDGEPGQPGSLVLEFGIDPLELRRWRLVDQQGVVTEVTLQNPEFGIAIDAKRFDFGELDLPDGQRPEGGR